MATTPTWTEFNGSGFTATPSVGNCNWKNVDDTTTVYSSSPIPATNPSMWKIQSLTLTNNGSSTASVYGLSYYISSNTGGTNTWTVYAAVPGTGSTTYRANGATAAVLPTATGFTPAAMPTSAGSLLGNWGGTNYTASSTPSTGPFAAPTTTAIDAASALLVTGSGGVRYATALYTQLQTGTAAVAGPIPSLTITATWTEF
jgi:hypothetical protein